MPAAAVIPAPIAYIKVVAVKKLVVGLRVRKGAVCRDGVHCLLLGFFIRSIVPVCSSLSGRCLASDRLL